MAVKERRERREKELRAEFARREEALAAMTEERIKNAAEEARAVAKVTERALRGE